MKSKIPKWMVVTIIVYIVLFTFMSSSRHLTLHSGWDLGIQEQLFTESIDGHFLYSPEFRMNYLGNHFNLIVIPLLPFYYIFNNTTFLFFIQSLAIAVGMIPLFLLAKKFLPDKYASIISIIYIIQPNLWHVNLGDFHFMALAVPLILFTFYFIEEKQWIWYWIMIGLLIIIKEDLSVLILFIGLYLLLRKETKKGIITMLIGASWFIFVINKIMPLLNNGELFGSGYIFYNIRYGYLGNSIGEIITNFFSNPWHYFTYIPLTHKIFYILQFFKQLLFIPVLSLSIIVALPIIGINIMSADISFFQMCPTSHHSAHLIPVLLVGLLFGLVWIKKRMGLNWIKKLIIIILILNILFAFTNGLRPYLNTNYNNNQGLPEGMACYKNEFRIGKNINQQDSQIYSKELLAKIKELDPNKSIAASTSIYPHLIHMKNARSVHLYKNYYDEDLLFFDYSDEADAPAAVNTNQKEFIEKNNNYTVIWNLENLYLYEKNS